VSARFSTPASRGAKRVARVVAGEVLCRHCLRFVKVGGVPGKPNLKHWRTCGEASSEARRKGWL
jgi:hypothetical protein